MQVIYAKIDGINCNHCVDKITKGLLENKKIKEVKIKSNIATITYQGSLKKEEIIKIIKELDYFTKEEMISTDLKEIDTNITKKEFLLILIIILLIVFIIDKLFGFNILNNIPTIDSSLTYGMLFITGLLTSIHCISMCGAINLLAVINTSNKRSFKRPLLYNLGRLLSYTLLGGLVGLIGSVLSLNKTIYGIIIILVAFLMLAMSFHMLGLISLKWPKWHLKEKKKSTNSFIIGLLNGFMPCGPLQAMQLYALSTGSFFKGAVSMFLFGLGTIPLMFMVGLFLNLVKGKGKIIINKIASIFILLLSLIMVNRGLLMLNIDVLKPFHNYDNFTASILYEEYQLIEFDLSYSNYEDIIVQKGIPVKMIVHVDEKYLTGCNNEIVMPAFDIQQKLEVGENIIMFTPTKTGTFTYTCWMNMIKNNIKVIDNKSYFKEGENE